MPNSVKTNQLKVNIMPEDVHNHYINNNLINENELYLVEDNNTVLSLREGGTGIAATSVAEVRTALGVAAADHTSTEPSCGTGSDLKYGHVKLSDDIDSELGVNDGVAATPAAVNYIQNNLHTHIQDDSNPHKVTKEQVGLSDVENKSSETIRGEITENNIVNALGYKPSTITIRTWTENDLEG